MKTYRVEIVGKSPLLMHWDNIAWASEMEKWQAVPENKKVSKAGDDRTPPFRWLGCVYHDGTHVALPSDNIMRCSMEAGAAVPVPGGKNGKTFKAQTQSGMLTGESYWPLLVNGKPVPWAKLEALRKETDFDRHCEAAAKLGFQLYVKRGKIGMSKHIRVRPRFDRWSAVGTMTVWDDQITLAVLEDIFRVAGNYKGLGDWRPSSRTPGPFGRFDAKVTEV